MAGERRALRYGRDGGDLGTGSPRLSEDRSPALIAERARRRVMWRLMPFLILVYLLAYIDRSNLAVAKLQMQTELQFSDATNGLGAGIFFIGYFLLEIPGSLIVERYSARKW